MNPEGTKSNWHSVTQTYLDPTFGFEYKTPLLPTSVQFHFF